MICDRLSIARRIGFPFSPMAERAIAKSTAKATICSTSPRTMASTTLAGKMCTIVSTSVLGWFSSICCTVSVTGAASVTPTPGFVRLTTARPMKRAIVVTISK